MKQNIKKVFLDITKEEAWLNEQGQKGLKLVHYHNGNYEFERAEPAQFCYHIDIPTFTGDKKKDYFAFLEESGISVVAEYGGRVYLRKDAADGPLELYTTNMEVYQQMSKRYSHLIGGGVSQISLAIYLLLHGLLATETYSAPFWICVVISIAFIISGTVFVTLAIVKTRQNSPQTTKRSKGTR